MILTKLLDFSGNIYMKEVKTMNERELIEGLHNSINRYVDLLYECARQNQDMNKLIACMEWNTIDSILYDILIGNEKAVFSMLEKKCEKLEKELRCTAQKS